LKKTDDWKIPPFTEDPFEEIQKIDQNLFILPPLDMPLPDVPPDLPLPDAPAGFTDDPYSQDYTNGYNYEETSIESTPPAQSFTKPSIKNLPPPVNVKNGIPKNLPPINLPPPNTATLRKGLPSPVNLPPPNVLPANLPPPNAAIKKPATGITNLPPPVFNSGTLKGKLPPPNILPANLPPPNFIRN